MVWVGWVCLVLFITVFVRFGVMFFIYSVKARGLCPRWVGAKAPPHIPASAVPQPRRLAHPRDDQESTRIPSYPGFVCPIPFRPIPSRPVLSGPDCDSLPPPGNDLARSYGWGPGFSHRMLKAKFLEKVKKASAVLLDRCVCGVLFGV